MNVIKYFFKNIRANKVIFLLYIAIFVANLWISSSANVNTQTQAFEETRAKVGLIKLSNDATANAIESYLREYSKEELSYLPDDLMKAKEMVFMGVHDAIVRIPENCEELYKQDKAPVQLIFNTMEHEGNIVDNRLHSFLMLLRTTQKDGEYDTQLLHRILKEEVEVVLLQPDITPETEIERHEINIFFNTGGYILMAIYIWLINMSMRDFKTLENKNRIAVSSKNKLRMQIEIYTAQVLVGGFVTAVIIALGFVLKGTVLFEHQIEKHILNLAIYSLVIMAFSFMIGSLTDNRQAQNGLATICSLGFAFISGVFVPQEFLSSKVLAIAKFFPLYYFVELNQTVQPSVAFVTKNLGTQLLFGILFLVTGLYISQKRRMVE